MSNISTNRKLHEYLRIAKENQFKKLTLGSDSGNEYLTDLPKLLFEIDSLEELDLHNNRLSFLRADIQKLTNLRILNLAGNNLKKLPIAIGKLLNLASLNLHSNNLSSLPSSIGKLEKLELLDISRNHFSEFPVEVLQLSNLQSLNLSDNKLTRLPDNIKGLASLQKLILDHNNIDKLSPEIGKLTKLTDLYLGDNVIDGLPPEIGNLRNLEILNLGTGKNPPPPPYAAFNEIYHANLLNSLPKETQHLTKLKFLYLEYNPLPIPPEIIKKVSNPKAILDFYFLSVEKSRMPLNEIKLLTVGQGSVGKTSLVQQILHGMFDQNQTKTEGISITQWSVDSGRLTVDSKNHQPSADDHQPIKLNIWDFGGQEIMHATHQFFLTKRSLYLLVLDARLTQEENRVEYWLKIIQSFGGESPVLIIGNKTDQHPLDIDRTGLQKKYPNIVGILETSAATGAGIAALKDEIAKQVDTLPHVHDLLPETWFTVKSKLEELSRDKNFITQDEYLNLCGANDVTDETSQHTLIGFLHDLGVVLHFQDDPRLEALGILNPQWVTNGVYKILNSHELFQNQGTLTLPILNKTLNPPEYPSNKRLFIVDMMKKFELCYDIEPDKSFLIPDLLPKDEIYTGEWDDALAFQYHYNVLPSSIITRFIVRMNTFIYKNTIWRSGVVLKYSSNTALVKADIEDKKIYIWVGGKQDTRRDFLAIIRGEFDAIHKTIAKIEVTEKVPVPNVPEATPIDLTFLQRAASEGRESLPVQVGNRIIDLIVKEVLSQIEKDGKSSPSNMVVNIQGNVYGSIGNNNTVNFIQQKFEPIYEAIKSSSHEAIEKQDLIAEVDEIKDEVAKGEQANESFLSRRLRNLKKMAPDIAEVALATLANPVAGLGMIVQKVAKKIKDETK